MLEPALTKRRGHSHRGPGSGGTDSGVQAWTDQGQDWSKHSEIRHHKTTLSTFRRVIFMMTLNMGITTSSSYSQGS